MKILTYISFLLCIMLFLFVYLTNNKITNIENKQNNIITNAIDDRSNIIYNQAKIQMIEENLYADFSVDERMSLIIDDMYNDMLSGGNARFVGMYGNRKDELPDSYSSTISWIGGIFSRYYTTLGEADRGFDNTPFNIGINISFDRWGNTMFATCMEGYFMENCNEIKQSKYIISYDDFLGDGRCGIIPLEDFNRISMEVKCIKK